MPGRGMRVGGVVAESRSENLSQLSYPPPTPRHVTARAPSLLPPMLIVRERRGVRTLHARGIMRERAVDGPQSGEGRRAGSDQNRRGEVAGRRPYNRESWRAAARLIGYSCGEAESEATGRSCSRGRPVLLLIFLVRRRTAAIAVFASLLPFARDYSLYLHIYYIWMLPPSHGPTAPRPAGPETPSAYSASRPRRSPPTRPPRHRSARQERAVGLPPHVRTCDSRVEAMRT